ncbi:MAG: ribosomal protein [Candidatus Parcubacteria bacterium]|jgi:large subunit ribosomal protein L24
MSKWLRKGDRVQVIAGNDKGKSGEILSCSEERVVVQGVNVRKKHMRPTQQSQGGGRIVEMEMSIHKSNVRLCDKDGKPLVVRMRVGKKGERDLVFGKGDKETVYRSMKKV